MLNIQPEPGEELCDCSTCKRLEHEPMSARVIHARMHAGPFASWDGEPGKGEIMSGSHLVYLYRPGGTCGCCELSDLRWCLGLAMDHGWRPAVGDPSSYPWGLELEVWGEDATALASTLERALAAPKADRAGTSVGSGWGPTRMRLSRELIEFCRQGGFESADDDFPTLATRDEVLERVRQLATRVTHLCYTVAVSGCVGMKWCRERIRIYRTLDSIDRYLGGDHAERAFKEAEEAYATDSDPVWWAAFVAEDPEHLEQLMVQERVERTPEFLEDVMKYVRGVEHDIGGTREERWAQNVEVVIARKPELALPENKTHLLESCKREIKSRLLNDANPQ